MEMLMITIVIFFVIVNTLLSFTLMINGTIFDEAEALIEFKKSSITSDPRNALESWMIVPGFPPNPCGWARVLCSLNSVTELNLSSLDLGGRLSIGDLMILPNLHNVDLHQNYFSGSLTHALHPCSFVSVDLSFNKFDENIAGNFLGSCSSLINLDLSHNEITGGGYPFGSTLSLQSLDLSQNNISDYGLYSFMVSNCQGLRTLNLSTNALTGEFLSVSRCTNLISLDASYNLFTTKFPSEFFFAADLPASLSRLFLTGNKFSDGFSIENNCGNLKELDLSHNSITGDLSTTIFLNCSKLQFLDMSDNKLTGELPANSMMNSKSLEIIDISHNNLTGPILDKLSSLSLLKVFDVSYNNLSGEIPTKGQFPSFPIEFFIGNPSLCGFPLTGCGLSPQINSSQTNSTSSTIPNVNVNSASNRKAWRVKYILCIVLFSTLMIFFLVILTQVLRNKKKAATRLHYIKSLPRSKTSTWNLDGIQQPLAINVLTFGNTVKKLTFAHLLEATNGFSEDSLIGSGGFGEVYKAHLKNNNIVAIKKLNHTAVQGDREFMAEMETVGRIKHKNLVPLLGYCKVGNERLLVYEYMKHGSLEDALTSKMGEDNKKSPDSTTRKHTYSCDGLSLNWDMRRKIAIGSAKGLAFLHHNCVPHIIHRDMKSSNVLIDSTMEGRVSDFGMARVANAIDTHVIVTQLSGTPGYVPPEYYRSYKCTTKGDVYSYGVVLLELISGKKPINEEEFGDGNLVEWAKKNLKENRVIETIDPMLRGEGLLEEEIIRFLKVAYDCLEDRPLRRPSMIHVIIAFKEIINGNEADFEGFLDGGEINEESTEDLV
ncbi:hypothetical protein ZOSMA_60G00080 [Zostera marina]|uniref:non-specific serine/threonine protein kinase n=1 Tax=Zostera marina TaxID=29655 RepID=A0A0K9NVQ4_ZOSMR|nr:hypothetical protein ZOSMA_60G00080 [Zostera marina]